MTEKNKFSDIQFLWVKRYGENRHNNEINAIAVSEAESINNFIYDIKYFIIIWLFMQ